MRAFVAFCLAAAPALAEKWYMHRVDSLPTPKTLDVVHYFTVKGEADASIQVEAPVVTSQKVQTNGLELAIVHYDNFLTVANATNFCCDQLAISEGKCTEVNTLILTGNSKIQATELGDRFSWKMKPGPEIGGQASLSVTGGEFKPKKEGVYVVMQVNCGDNDESGVKYLKGEVTAKTAYGFLPGAEYPKLAFYQGLSLVYFAAAIMWGLTCVYWKSYLFSIHHMMTGAILVGLIEAVCWTVSLFHWNVVGHRLWSMIFLAIFGTVLKQGISFSLILAGSMGWGVTKPQLGGVTFCKILMLFIFFVCGESFRLLSIIEKENLIVDQAPVWQIALACTPGSLAIALFFSWTYAELASTIDECVEFNQNQKLELYQNLKTVLFVVISAGVGLCMFDAFIQPNFETSWGSKWLFSDAISHSIFFVLLVYMMHLWKPNERSKDYAYSQQLVNEGEGDIEMVDQDVEDGLPGEVVGASVE